MQNLFSISDLVSVSHPGVSLKPMAAFWAVRIYLRGVLSRVKSNGVVGMLYKPPVFNAFSRVRNIPRTHNRKFSAFLFQLD